MQALLDALAIHGANAVRTPSFTETANVGQAVSDTAKAVGVANTLRGYLAIPANFRKLLRLPVAPPVLGGLVATAARVADTPTQDYYTRFGLRPPNSVSPLREAVADGGVRSLGAASDLGPSLVGAATPFMDGPESALRSRLFRDVR